MAVTRRTLQLQEQIRRDLQRITDQHTRALVSAWADAWEEISTDLTASLLDQLTAGDQVTRAQLLRSTRLRKALAVTLTELERLSTLAGVTVTGNLARVVDIAGAAQASVIDSQLPPKSGLLDDLDSWSRVDADQLTAIVNRSTEQITSLTKPLASEAYDVVRRELIRGVASGSNPKATAARMVRRAEGGFNGGLSRALVIARTETLDAHRAGAALGQAQHTDVLTGWTWLAKLDARTCPSCWAQHGRVHDQADPGPQDHQQGRCSRMPTTKSWADLGFDVAEPPSLLPNASDAFDALSSKEQLAVLGTKRHQAWTQGDYPIESWSQRRTTDGWRDSFAVSPVPSSASRRSVA